MYRDEGPQLMSASLEDRLVVHHVPVGDRSVDDLPACRVPDDRATAALGLPEVDEEVGEGALGRVGGVEPWVAAIVQVDELGALADSDLEVKVGRYDARRLGALGAPPGNVVIKVSHASLDGASALTAEVEGERTPLGAKEVPKAPFGWVGRVALHGKSPVCNTELPQLLGELEEEVGDVGRLASRSHAFVMRGAVPPEYQNSTSQDRLTCIGSAMTASWFLRPGISSGSALTEL